MIGKNNEHLERRLSTVNFGPLLQKGRHTTLNRPRHTSHIDQSWTTIVKVQPDMNKIKMKNKETMQNICKSTLPIKITK